MAKTKAKVAVVEKKEAPKKKEAPSVLPYEKVMWRGRIPVYKCRSCKFQSDVLDDMRRHVVRHK